MARPKVSAKHLQIDKANQALILATSIAAVILVFGFFAGRALFLRQQHQARVISEKEKAVTQLKANIEAKEQLVASYRTFVTSERNFLGGSSAAAATGEKDGDNARLILDALPSKYDFPALTTSLEKLLAGNGYTIDAIEGTDDEVNQAAVAGQANPEPVEIPFSFSVTTSYNAASPLIGLFENSIRPFKINSLTFTAEESSLKINAQATTYYQPEKVISITKKVVK